MNPILRYLELLLSAFEYDYAIFSTPSWMYYTVFPMFFYVCFFFAKWAILTAPFWLPLGILFGKIQIRIK